MPMQERAQAIGFAVPGVLREARRGRESEKAEREGEGATEHGKRPAQILFVRMQKFNATHWRCMKCQSSQHEQDNSNLSPRIVFECGPAAAQKIILLRKKRV